MGLAPVFCCRTGRTVVCRREQEGEEAVSRGLPQSLRFFGDSDGSDWVLPPTAWNVVTFLEEKESVRQAEGDFVWVTLEVTVLLGATGSRYGEEEGTKKGLRCWLEGLLLWPWAQKSSAWRDRVPPRSSSSPSVTVSH